MLGTQPGERSAPESEQRRREKPEDRWKHRDHQQSPQQRSGDDDVDPADLPAERAQEGDRTEHSQHGPHDKRWKDEDGGSGEHDADDLTTARPDRAHDRDRVRVLRRDDEKGRKQQHRGEHEQSPRESEEDATKRFPKREIDRGLDVGDDGATLGSRTWDDMARDVVALAQS